MAEQPLALCLIKVSQMCSGKLPQVCIALVSTVYVSLTKTTLFKTEDSKKPVVLPTALLREAEGQLHKKKWV